MPKRDDIKSVMILGSGPIVIGQACEFDYSGTQAVKTLKQEGLRVILVNSNPATIMTDRELAHATYIEPIHWEVVARIIEKERPDALLPTMGGQTALNCAMDLDREGVLAKFGVEMIGANRESIDRAEDRELFRDAMRKIGLPVPRSSIAHSLEEALQVQAYIGFPTIIRPSFTLGGSGGGIAYNQEEFIELSQQGIQQSPTNEILIEESLIGWKEFELEVIRDKKDNVIIVCSIENLDPMGVHTGDSITVAPAQTLTDKEYQNMREAAIQIIREIGVETGGANVQFGVHPKDGRMVVIEMNPRVSRSSALASKATGFPIAKIATKLALGYTLDECPNEITQGRITAAFEPTLDYVVIKMPRFNFDKFPNAEKRLSTQMKSVGESMAIGSNFKEALQKAIRGLEIDREGLVSLLPEDLTSAGFRGKLHIPTPDRLWYVADAFRKKMTIDEIYELTNIDLWFLNQIAELIKMEDRFISGELSLKNKNDLFLLKQNGFSDKYLAELCNKKEEEIRQLRLSQDIKPVYKRIDSCAGEFPSDTVYMYGTYQKECESNPTTKKKIIILGSGPNRIGQGIEFDYCCVHACQALESLGYEAIMINCNPETVSTDFDVVNRLYFEAVTLEEVLSIIEKENPLGVMVQFGGQTPLKIANALQKAGVPIIGTSTTSIEMTEDRGQFQKLANELGLKQPPNAAVISKDQAFAIAEKIGYPLMIRPSYVLGGRAMTVVYSNEELEEYCENSLHLKEKSSLLLERYLLEAVEVDVDAVSDGTNVFVPSILEHIEHAGVHSGDSACSLPPFSLSEVIQERIKTQMIQIAKKLNVIGLINAQFAVQHDDIYVLEVNPRASRTVPFVSKAIGIPLAQVAAKCAVGYSIDQQGIKLPSRMAYYAIKLPVFPFGRFKGVDILLGPEMRSTGEVMGIAQGFGQAYAKALLAASAVIKKRKKAFVSVRNADKPHIAVIAKSLVELGFEVLATKGTARVIDAAGIPVTAVNKVIEGQPHIVDLIKNNEIDFIVNTTDGKQAISDSFIIRENALLRNVAYTTTLAGAKAACLSMKYEDRSVVTCLQSLG